MSCCDHDGPEPRTDERYRRVLWAALAVNLAMFLVEIVASIIAGSVSVRADALDFLADAANYTVALAVVGLAAGDRVVTEGVGKLRPGTPVKAVVTAPTDSHPGTGPPPAAPKKKG